MDKSELRQQLARPKAIFFDLDQTLILHSREVSSLAANAFQVLDPQHDYAIGDFSAALMLSGRRLWDRIDQHVGRSEEVLIGMVSDALSTVGSDPALAAQILEMIMEGITDSTRVTPDALRMLDDLKEMGIAVAIVTNGFTTFQVHKAHVHSLLDRVDFIVTSQDAGAHKPNRLIFQMALRKAGISAAQAWYVGDSLERDVRGSNLAGMLSVLFDPSDAYKSVSDRPPFTSPTFVVQELIKIPTLIKRL